MARQNRHLWVPPEDLDFQLRFWLHIMPWLSAEELSDILVLPESTVRDALEVICSVGSAFHVELGAHRRLTKRYALAGSGLGEISRAEGLSLSGR